MKSGNGNIHLCDKNVISKWSFVRYPTRFDLLALSNGVLLLECHVIRIITQLFNKDRLEDRLYHSDVIQPEMMPAFKKK